MKHFASDLHYHFFFPHVNQTCPVLGKLAPLPILSFEYISGCTFALVVVLNLIRAAVSCLCFFSAEEYTYPQVLLFLHFPAHAQPRFFRTF